MPICRPCWIASNSDGAQWLGKENVPIGRRLLVRSADMRYPLQNYEINVTLPMRARSCLLAEAMHATPFMPLMNGFTAIAIGANRFNSSIYAFGRNRSDRACKASSDRARSFKSESCAEERT